MATRYRDLFFAPLDFAAATKLAATLEDLLTPGDSPEDTSESGSLPLGYEGTPLRVSSADQLREEDEGYLFDGDVSVGAEAGVPTEDELRARGIELDAEGRERLLAARSTLRLVHDARVADEPVFVSLQRSALALRWSSLRGPRERACPRKSRVGSRASGELRVSKASPERRERRLDLARTARLGSISPRRRRRPRRAHTRRSSRSRRSVGDPARR